MTASDLAKALRQRRGSLSALRKSGAVRLVETLRTAGVTRFYCVPGSSLYALMEAAHVDGLDIIACRTHASAVFAAAADNHFSGELRAAVLLCAGPGLVASLSALKSVREAESPLLAIYGTQSDLRAFQGCRHDQMIEAGVKTYFRVETADEVGTLCDQAIWEAFHCVPGPVLVELSQHILADTTEIAGVRPAVVLDETPEASKIAQLSTALSQARAPLICVGRTARWIKPADAIARLVMLTGSRFAGCPAAASLLGRDHPAEVFRTDRRVFSQSDLVVTIGCDLDWAFRWGGGLQPTARVFAIGRSPARDEFRMPDEVLIHGDASEVVASLIAAMANKDHKPSRTKSRQRDDTPVGQWLAALDAAMPGRAITILDGGAILLKAEAAIPPLEPWSRLTPGTDGHIGSGLGHAIGAQLSAPERPVLLITGDYALGLTLMDLETLVRKQLPAKVVVFADHEIGSSKSAGRGLQLPNDVVNFPTRQRFDEVMTALGGKGFYSRVEDAPQPVIDAFLSYGGPALLHLDSRGTTMAAKTEIQ